MSPRPGNAALAGNRVPRRHRFFLSDGRILTGDLYRSPNSRLADHVAALKGYISVVNAVMETDESSGTGRPGTSGSTVRSGESDGGSGVGRARQPDISGGAGPGGTTMEFIALNSAHVLLIEELEGETEGEESHE